MTDIGCSRPHIVEGAIVRATSGDRRLMLVVRTDGDFAVCLGRRGQLSYPIEALEMLLPPSDQRAHDEPESDPVKSLLLSRS